MNRVSTLGNYQSALLDLFAAQSRQADATKRLSTEKIATDLVGFGRGSETITALKGAENRVKGFLEVGEATLARLDAQDLAMVRANDAIGNARSAIGEAIAADAAGTLMLELENAFQSIRGGLNAQHQGVHVFAGGNSDVPPVSATSLTELAAAPDAASVFTNGDLRQSSRVAETTTLRTGFLANELGTETLGILRDLKIYFDANPIPIDGKIDAAQKAFLSTQLDRLGTASTTLVEDVARNGALYQQVERLNESNDAQALSLKTLVGKRTDADLAQAATDIQLSTIALQASAQVISQLRETSLLNFLR